MDKKLLARKAASKPIEFLEVRADHEALTERKANLDNRIIEGYAVIWGSKNQHGERFYKGAFKKAINDMGVNSNSEYKIKFRHEHDEVICLFEVLEEDEIGLYFRTVALPENDPTADKILRKLKDGTYNNFSIGFRYVWDKMRYDEVTDTIEIYEAFLLEISVVGIPSDLNTFAIRTAQDLADLADETEEFIRALPRKTQLEARNLFAKHKALFENNEQQIEERKALEEKEKQSNNKSLDFSYICANLTLN